MDTELLRIVAGLSVKGEEDFWGDTANKVSDKILKTILGGNKLKTLIESGLFQTPIDENMNEDDLVWVAVSAVFKHLNDEFGLNKRDQIELRDKIYNNI